jgi:hypothetical protein
VSHVPSFHSYFEILDSLNRQCLHHIQTFLKWSLVPLAALAAMAFVSLTRPASAGEYCRKDVTSQVVSCSFDTLEQCQETSSGRAAVIASAIPGCRPPTSSLMRRARFMPGRRRITRPTTIDVCTRPEVGRLRPRFSRRAAGGPFRSTAAVSI